MEQASIESRVGNVFVEQVSVESRVGGHVLSDLANKLKCMLLCGLDLIV